MKLADRIEDARTFAEYEVLATLLDERDATIRSVTCDLAAERAECALLRDEIERLTAGIEKLEQELRTATMS